MAAQLTIERSDAAAGTRTLSIVGELDIATTPQLEQEVEQALREGARAIAIDLAGLSFIDSTGLRMFLRLNELAGAGGWRLTMTRPSEQVKKVLRVTGTSSELPIAED